MTIFERTLRATARTCAAIFVVLAAAGIAMLPEEISRNRRLPASFASAASWVDGFAEAHGRLPSNDEYKAWAASQPKRSYGVQSICILDPTSSQFQDAVYIFGPPKTENTYVLAARMRVGNDYYASWAKESTAGTLPEDYVFYPLFFGFLVAGAFVCRKVARGPRRPSDALLT
jgi:hypothetical protein